MKHWTANHTASCLKYLDLCVEHRILCPYQDEEEKEGEEDLLSEMDEAWYGMDEDDLILSGQFSACLTFLETKGAMVHGYENNHDLVFFVDQINQKCQKNVAGLIYSSPLSYDEKIALIWHLWNETSPQIKSYLEDKIEVKYRKFASMLFPT